MIPYPHIDPEIIRVGPLAIRWYGLMYLLGFAASYLLVQYQIKKKDLAFDKDFLGSLYSYAVFGLLVGARLGYVLFYNPSYYLHHPLETFALWQAGCPFTEDLSGASLPGYGAAENSGQTPGRFRTS